VSGGIGQPESHLHILIEAISGGESSPENIFFMNVDSIITQSKINLGEYLCFDQLIK
jgi:hypothetical protein